MRCSTLRPALLLGALLTVSASAQVEGVGYRVAPSGAYVLFEGNAGLSDGFLYGGGGGLSFGEFLELNGAYLFGTGFETDYSEFSGLENAPDIALAITDLAVREVDVQRYGGDLKLNLSTGAAVPFLRGGAGIIRFEPDGAESSRSLYLSAGAGVQFAAADRYTVSVSGNAFGYRYNPGTTFFTRADLNEAGLSLDEFNQVEVINPSIEAALQLYLGGRRPGSLTELDREFQRQFSGGLSGLSLVIEPFYARSDFDPAFNYSNQTFVGAEAGFDLGPLVGLRGFYGRGVADDDPTEYQEIDVYGGDVRLRLNAGSGLVPFLTVGAGYLDVSDEYAATFGDDPEVDRALAEDRPFAIGGGGIEIPFGPRLRAVGEVRALVMSTQEEGDVSMPDDVFISPSYRAGLSLGLGGTTGDPNAVVADRVEAERQRLEAELEAERARALADLEAERLESEARLAELQREVELARATGDAAEVARLEARRDVAARQSVSVGGRAIVEPVGPDGVAEGSLPTPIRTTRGERIVTIPLPEVGELYVRYGEPGGVSIESTYQGVEGGRAAPTSGAAPGATEEDVRAAVRDALREARELRDDDALTDDDLDEIERRVEDRVADRLGDRVRDDRDGVSAADLAALEARLLAAMQQAVATPAPVVVDEDGEVVEAPRPGVQRPVVAPEPARDARQRGFYGVSPTVGLGFGETGNVLVGLRGEYASGGTVTYLPELLVGVTGRRSFSANLDAAFGVPSRALASYGTPYVRLGVGVVNLGDSEADPDTFDRDPDDGGTSLAFNLGLGAELVYGGGRFFADFTTGNFGQFNRLTAGYRFPFGRRTY